MFMSDMYEDSTILSKQGSTSPHTAQENMENGPKVRDFGNFAKHRDFFFMLKLFIP